MFIIGYRYLQCIIFEIKRITLLKNSSLIDFFFVTFNPFQSKIFQQKAEQLVYLYCREGVELIMSK